MKSATNPKEAHCCNVPNHLNLDRREVRIHCMITVQFRLGCLNNYGVCWNLGLHGMYIEYDGDVAPEEPIELSFVLSDEYPSVVEAAGRVVWINIGSQQTQKHMPEGFGIVFTQISPEARSVVQKFINLY